MRIVGIGCGGLAAVAALAIGSFLVWWNWVPLHESSWTHDNERLLASVPAFPGARVIRREVSSYDDSSGCLDICIGPTRTIGYRLVVDYTVPRGTRPLEPIRWYARHLNALAWHRVPDDAVPTFVAFARGGAEIVVDTQTLGDGFGDSDLELTVDRKGTNN